MWDILIPSRRRIYVANFLEEEDNMILRMKTIIYICRFTCASWLPHLRTSGSELGWYLVLEIVFSVDMVLGAPVGYPLGFSINMFLGLALENSFGPWEGYFGYSLTWQTVCLYDWHCRRIFGWLITGTSACIPT